MYYVGGAVTQATPICCPAPLAYPKVFAFMRIASAMKATQDLLPLSPRPGDNPFEICLSIHVRYVLQIRHVCKEARFLIELASSSNLRWPHNTPGLCRPDKHSVAIFNVTTRKNPTL